MWVNMRYSRWISFGSVLLLCSAVVACGDDSGSSSSGDGGSGAAGGSGGSGGSGGMAAVCGDGVIDAGEVCDDGNTMVDDGCGATCQTEDGWDCMGAPSTCTSVCGDGKVVGAEACDDMNTADGDGCSAMCAEEAGYACNGEPSVCAPVCGDGTTIAPETCDDMNTATGDGCDDSCLVEAGYMCTGDPSVCTTTCGDGVVAGAETCDDGNTTAGDGCDDMCATEMGYDCMGDPSVCAPVCGDGMIIAPEACDDMNTANGDGCDQGCVVEAGWVCDNTTPPSVCNQNCGNGTIDMGEQCDDGNVVNGDRCDMLCQLEYTVLDMEPNDTVANAQTVVDGDIVVGKLDVIGNYDIYELVLAAPSYVILETYSTVDADATNYSSASGTLGPVVDCSSAALAHEDTKIYLFDAAGDVTDTTTAIATDDDGGDNLCSALNIGDTGLLPAGTYYVRVSEFDDTDTMEQYALDVQIKAPLAAGATCDPNLDLCDVSALLFCDPVALTCQSSCGNGTIDGTELCDDGNMVDTDRCANNCTLNADVIDTEVNDTFATAQVVTDGQVVMGMVDPANGDAWDLYAITPTVTSWIQLDQYTTVDGDLTNNNSPGATINPDIDCVNINGSDGSPDIWLFDAAGDPTDDTTALVFDGSDGDGLCGYIGPKDGAAALLTAGQTYYIKVRGYSTSTFLGQYAVDVDLMPALNAGDPCDTTFDLCDASVGLACDATANTCGIPVPDPMDIANWQFFGSGTFDLANVTLTFTPIAGTYGVVATPSGAAYPDVAGMGTVATAVIGAGDSTSDQQAFTMNFPFFGTTYNDVYIGSNGYLTFGAGDTTTFGSASAHFDLPRVSGFFGDLDASDAASGPVTFDEYADHITVTYDNVIAWNTADVVNMQLQLFDNGVVVITYLGVSAQKSAVVGISSGTNLSNPPAQLDFSAQIPKAPVAGDLVINEVMINAAGVDTNCDGVLSGTDDEFVELVNVSGVPLDMTGVTLGDGAVAVRHTFSSVVVPAGRAIVVYGAGAAMCPNVLAEISTTGALGLSNGGDTVQLSTNDMEVFPVATAGISFTRNPDIVGAFVLHNAAAGATVNFTPGYRVTGDPF